MFREISSAGTLPSYFVVRSQMEQIEKHPGWQGERTLSEAALLLDGQLPLTFMLTYLISEEKYILSYVEGDKSIKHVIFTTDCKKHTWCYSNGTDNEFPTLNQMIKGAMHCEEAPIPLYGNPLS